MNKVLFKIAASSVVLGLTMVGCKPTGNARPAALSSQAPKAAADAAKLAGQAEQAVQAGRTAEALDLAERAVELDPRDAGYRMLLADLYLKNGRFQSAETAFGDVLALDPGNQRAQLRAALAQIATGKDMAALVRLDRLAETAAPGDIGLAYALAGRADRAVALLEPAARAAGADGRVRQNLALAYALSGDWKKARIVAAQDVSPGELDQRLQSWAAMASPQASHDRVASLLGVRAVADPGQPTKLALAPLPEQAIAAHAAASAPRTIAQIPEAPVQYAAIEAPAAPLAPVPALAFQPMPEPQPLPALQPQAETYTAAVETLVAPAGPIKHKPRIAGQHVRALGGARVTKALLEVAPEQSRRGRFVVQIGAFRTPEQVEKAWAQVYRRYDIARAPLSTVVDIPGKGRFHRLAIAGFETHAQAAERCGRIKARGGACFVRTTAGDAPVQWASRYTRNA